jgi:hypothetical protein
VSVWLAPTIWPDRLMPVMKLMTPPSEVSARAPFCRVQMNDRFHRPVGGITDNRSRR